MADEAATPHPSLEITPDGRVVSSFSKREIAVLEKLAEFFVDEEHFAAMKELIRLWQTLGGFGWFGRMMVIGVISLASFIGAVTVLLHYLGNALGGTK